MELIHLDIGLYGNQEKKTVCICFFILLSVYYIKFSFFLDFIVTFFFVLRVGVSFWGFPDTTKYIFYLLVYLFSISNIVSNRMKEKEEEEVEEGFVVILLINPLERERENKIKRGVL